MTPPPKPRGRPPLAPQDKRDRVIKVAVNAAEGAALDALAAAEGRPLAEVIRDRVLPRPGP